VLLHVSARHGTRSTSTQQPLSRQYSTFERNDLFCSIARDAGWPPLVIVAWCRQTTVRRSLARTLLPHATPHSPCSGRTARVAHGVQLIMAIIGGLRCPSSDDERQGRDAAACAGASLTRVGGYEWGVPVPLSLPSGRRAVLRARAARPTSPARRPSWRRPRRAPSSRGRPPCARSARASVLLPRPRRRPRTWAPFAGWRF